MSDHLTIKDDYNNNNNNNNNRIGNSNGIFDDFDDDCDLISRFLRLNSDESGNIMICEPQSLPQTTHFSLLPYEVILYILKWVVSNELDLRSLEMFSLACRGFYIASRDAELWRLACYNAWPNLNSSLISHYGNNWRAMYLERARPNFNGAYISRTTYIRQGESSFQDLHYRPCYVVEYYRYFRFFPDGIVLMLTTADDPHQSLPLLRQRKPTNNNVLVGYYRINGSSIDAVLKRDYYQENSNLSRNNRATTTRDKAYTTQTFTVSLELRNYKRKRNCQLCWSYYSVHYRRSNGQENETTFDLTPNLFPVFWFSRVKSYVSDSEKPLSPEY